jgi:hypothetical protein
MAHRIRVLKSGARHPPPCVLSRRINARIPGSIVTFRLSQEHRGGRPVSFVPAIEHIGTARAKALGAAVFHQRGIGAMGLFAKDIKTMDDLFVHQLQDIYYAEKQLVKALPKMAA